MSVTELLTSAIHLLYGMTLRTRPGLIGISRRHPSGGLLLSAFFCRPVSVLPAAHGCFSPDFRVPPSHLTAALCDLSSGYSSNRRISLYFDKIFFMLYLYHNSSCNAIVFLMFFHKSQKNNVSLPTAIIKKKDFRRQVRHCHPESLLF